MSDKIKKECNFENEILTLFDELNCSFNEEDDLVYDDGKEDLALLLSSKKTYTRLKDCVDNEARDVLISQLSDFDYSSRKYKEFSSYLDDVKDFTSKMFQQLRAHPSFLSLNQVLKSFKLHNDMLEMMKGFDEDVFVSRVILDSGLPYSEEFAEAVCRMRLSEEKKQKRKNNVEIETIFEEIQDILFQDDDSFYEEKNGTLSVNKDDDFQEEVLEGNSFQTCMSNQKRLFKMQRTPFYLVVDCFCENLRNTRLLDSSDCVETYFYTKEVQKLFELNSRLYSQKFVNDYFFKTCNTFIDVQAASKECFKPMFLSVLDLRKSLSEKEKTAGTCSYEKTFKKNVSCAWDKLVKKVSSDKELEDTAGWKNFISEVSQGNIEKIEEAWLIFGGNETLSDDIQILYADFILELTKNVLAVFSYPSKNVPQSPFEMVTLLEEIEKRERQNLKVLLKWTLKCALVDFQTFINLPLLKKAMKDMCEIIQFQISEELKNVFFIYKKTLKKMNLLNKIEIDRLKKIPDNHSLLECYKDVDFYNQKGKSFLLQSIIQNDVVAFEYILKSGTYVDDATGFGETPLILLAKLERYDWIDILLKYKPNVNSFDFNGGTCAHYLAAKNNVKLLKKISKMNANFNRVDSDECTPLFVAAENGNFETVRFLVEENVLVDKGNFLKKTPLHVALENGNEKIALFLIKNGANIFERDKMLKTSLHYAALSGLVNCVSFFIENDFNLNARDIHLRTPLHMACLSGQKMVVKKMIEAGVDLNSKDINGQTPLHVATAVGSMACVELLLSKGVDIDCLDKQGQTALYLAVLNNQKKPFKKLVEQGCKVYMKTKDLSSVSTLVQESTDRALKSCLKKYEESNTFFDIALFLGVFRENKALVEKAIIHGAHLNNLVVCEKNALEWALEIGNFEIIELLYRNNCFREEKRKVNMGHSSLIETIVQNDISNMKLLLKAGADANSHDEGTKYSVLHYASARGNIRAISVLIENGADINVKDARGKTPLYVARQTHQYEAEELLLSLGARDDESSKQISYLDEDE